VDFLTVLFLVAFVAMIAMHLRGHAGHGGGHGQGHDDHRRGDDVQAPDPTAPGTRPAEDDKQPVGAAGTHGAHPGHRHGC
jgi:hypothetical protein